MNIRLKPNYKPLLALLGLFLNYLFWPALHAQSYTIKGEEVIFEFDSRNYEKAQQDGTLEKLDFADLNIHEVVISGNFNNWSREGWRMEKVGRYKYQLHKKIVDFNDPFDWEFKFLVNGTHWVDPKEHPAKEKFVSNDFLNEVYGLKVNHVESKPDGNTRFFLEGFPDAEEVILAGSFNDWDEYYLKMYRTDGGWEIRLDLPPGRYEYKFIVDREWMHDPANPKTRRNEHATLNSILIKEKLVTFQLPGHENAKQVILAGSFNNWDEKEIQMQFKDGRWTYSTELVGGKHYYKFIIDGKWTVDPLNPIKESDRHGHVNSVLFVQ